MPASNGSLDTNVVLRLLVKDLPEQHHLARKLVSRPDAQFIVVDTVVIEIVFVLQRHYGFSRNRVAEAVNGLMSLSSIRCNTVLFAKALPLFVDHSALSFEDCCLAAYAELDDATPLWTFDKKLARQAPTVKLLA
jgi:predicted nucleic-acid-binding protein